MNSDLTFITPLESVPLLTGQANEKNQTATNPPVGWRVCGKAGLPPHQIIMFYVYILKSKKDGQCYIGSMKHFIQRLMQDKGNKIAFIVQGTGNDKSRKIWLIGYNLLASFTDY